MFRILDKISGQPLVSLPFNKDFQMLPIEQQKILRSQLDKKIQNNLSYSEILSELILNILENWNQFLSSWQTQNKINLSFRLTKLFKGVELFVEANDVYSLEQIIRVEPKMNYQPLSLIDSIKSIVELEKIVETIGNIQDFQQIKRKVVDPQTQQEKEEVFFKERKFQDIMNLFKNYFADMIKIIKKFATSQEEDLLLEKTDFILQRGFREFQKFYELDKDLIYGIKKKLTSNCSSVFQTLEGTQIPWALDFREKFFKRIDQNLLPKIFPSVQLLKDYEQLFNTYTDERLKLVEEMSKYEEDQCKIFFSDHRSSIQYAKADLNIDKGQKQRASLCYINSLLNVFQLQNCVIQTQIYKEEDKAKELNELSMRKVKIIKKLVATLKTFESQPNKYKKLALILTKHLNLIEEACFIYNLVIDSAPNHEKLNLYQEYAQLCLEWGRIEQATIAYQKKMKLDEDCFQNFMSSVNKLSDINNNREKYLNKCTENIGKVGRLTINDQILDQIIKQIRREVENL